MTASAAFVLWLTATSFDSTEAKAVGGIGGAAAAFEIMKRHFIKGDS